MKQSRNPKFPFIQHLFGILAGARRKHHREPLDKQIDQLIGLVDSLSLKHGFDPRTLTFLNQPDVDKQLSRKLKPPTSAAGESSAPYSVPRPIVEEPSQQESLKSFGKAVPPCPICGVTPHNLSIHDEWRYTPGTKSEEKIAADREATGFRSYLVPCDRSDGYSPVQHGTGTQHESASAQTEPAKCARCGSPTISWDHGVDIPYCTTCGATYPNALIE